MLRHIHLHDAQVYWYCPHCRQAMPNLEDGVGIAALLNYSQKHLETVSHYLSPNLTETVMNPV
jgi:hypothetical protein